MTRKHTSCSTGDGDGDGDGNGDDDGDGEGDGDGDGDGEGEGEGDGRGDDDGDGDGEVAKATLDDSEDDEGTEGIEESVKKNVNQDHIIQKIALLLHCESKTADRKGSKKWPPITFKTLKRTRFLSVIQKALIVSSTFYLSLAHVLCDCCLDTAVGCFSKTRPHNTRE